MSACELAGEVEQPCRVFGWCAVHNSFVVHQQGVQGVTQRADAPLAVRILHQHRGEESTVWTTRGSRSCLSSRLNTSHSSMWPVVWSFRAVSPESAGRVNQSVLKLPSGFRSVP